MASSQSSSSLGSSDRPASSRIEENQGKSVPHLESLIAHLVAAKRSLSSINHVWRANEIVTTARSAVEESVVVSARTGFLRRGLNNQLRLLYNVRAEVEEISHRGRADFSDILKDLDAADGRLRNTLDTLRDTIVHAAFRPEGEDPKSLHDFVDERGVEELHATLKSSIDRTNAAQAELDESNRAFDDELHSIKEALGQYRTAMKMASSRSSASSSSSSASTHSGMASLSALPGMLSSLEMHAQEMANLLESLVRHFDLCVTAVKHTEGGGAAARSITGDMPPVTVSGRNGLKFEEDINENLNAPLDPLTNSEYQEMVNVLVKDAAEAEDVVMEIQDRSGEMESVLENIIAQRDSLLSVSNATTDVFQHLSSLASTRLPGYIAKAHQFTRVWNEERDRISSGLAEFSDLGSLYECFLDAYDGLILEVSRRKHMRQRVEKVLRDTRQKLDQLFQEDVNAREAFRVEQGDYLPSDIWPGVSREPMRVDFLRISGGQLGGGAATEPVERDVDVDEDAAAGVAGPPPAAPADALNVGEVIPDIPRQAVEQALARLESRARITR
ncbi:hypothetical protein ASPZODRAFT_65671 [Penicilliopsis zonata CBS 506.65]|uniref:Autophagy-related protein 17 n=1 Tax=Penicilliopsis zonata CBS 506.65 TaxID=1073090 RepID=A0A1L9SJK0_9EURO|nr:hypothetical protein ASPZODRAFT_65671 [Penicilliopsis zonata CBS 506.65]OJJ47291.1 hypothetical protein ASPZODRAFT_65671 [Penicilliopsis zonata CBS 506.65]